VQDGFLKMVLDKWELFMLGYTTNCHTALKWWHKRKWFPFRKLKDHSEFKTLKLLLQCFRCSITMAKQRALKLKKRCMPK
jgi:hypothetical protein